LRVIDITIFSKKKMGFQVVLDLLEEETIKEFFKGDKLAKYLGIELTDVSIGKAVAKMVVKEEHLNGIGTVHGGAIFTLADFTFAVAANSHGRVTVAINANISYMKAVTHGTLTAVAREVSLNPKIASYTVDISNDKGELIAIFQGLAYRKRDKISI
jgi:acyl-CoA thioesterase